MCIVLFSSESDFIALSKYSLISFVKYFWRNKDGFEHIFIFPLLLRLWWLWTVLRWISPFLFVYFKEREPLKSIIFFNVSKASLTHKWNFHLILWVFTENRLCSVETEENKPICNSSYSLWGHMSRSLVTPAALHTTGMQQSPKRSTICHRYGDSEWA